MRARDQKQLDFEELSAYLHRTIQERERTMHPGRHLDGGINISELVTDKINEVRGIDMERARREKLGRLERKINEVYKIYFRLEMNKKNLYTYLYILLLSLLAGK